MEVCRFRLCRQASRQAPFKIEFPKNLPTPPPAPRFIESTTRGERAAESAAAESRSDDKGRDAFSRSEKWLPPMPQCEFDKWKNRHDKILRFAAYVSQLKAWTALGSDAFSFETGQSISWSTEIYMSNLKPLQQVRASRLLAMLQSTFAALECM